MRTLEMNEVQQVSGGLLPLVVAVIGVDLALNGVMLAYAAYAAANFHAEKK